MGSLNLPSSGLVVIDTMVAVYSVERHHIWQALLQPLWDAAKAGALRVGGSELLLMECLILPYRRSDASLVKDFRVCSDASLTRHGT